VGNRKLVTPVTLQLVLLNGAVSLHGETLMMLVTSMQMFFSLGSDARLQSEISIENNYYSPLVWYLMQYCSVIVKNIDNRQFTEQKTSG
jgi:hypothetical protein